MPLATAFDLSSGVSNNIFSEFNIPTGRNFTKNIYPAKSPFDMLYVCNENRYHVLRGPNPETGNKSLPGLTKNMTDFIVFLAENSKYCEGESQSNVYDMYDIYSLLSAKSGNLILIQFTVLFSPVFCLIF